MTTIDIPPTQGESSTGIGITAASATLTTVEVKRRIAMMFGDPVTEEPVALAH
ncbi:hypothetical protein [Rhodococcus sp. NPDC060176]|uniref:hypothetical protein n=1 Tax=Rhodococcus sp. NPDC060176 TaxID=3347062 RepID=UPI00365F32CB